MLQLVLKSFWTTRKKKKKEKQIEQEQDRKNEPSTTKTTLVDIVRVVKERQGLTEAKRNETQELPGT